MLDLSRSAPEELSGALGIHRALTQARGDRYHDLCRAGSSQGASGSGEPTMSFVHLHLHTLYSLLDGAIRMKDLVRVVGAMKMEAVAVTDHGNMFGAIDFYKKAKEAGIKPILGIETYVATKGRKDRTERSSHHLILLAKDAQGYANLRKLSSLAFTEGFYYSPRVDKELLAKHSEGLFCSTACLGGELPQAILNGHMDRARAAAQEYLSIFGPDRFFLELQSNGLSEQRQVNDAMKQLARDLGVGLLATADCHYERREHAMAQEILMCIASGKTLADENRIRHETSDLYIKSPAEMAAAFADVPEALANTLKIAEQCNLELKLGNPVLPSFAPPDGESENDCMMRLAREGLARRLAQAERRGERPDRDTYRARLDLELSVIGKMGFSGYFLIVQDFINWAKKNGVPVGPGRGSGAGSLVAYSLGITDLDPIPYNLLFERFLNPERVSMPDFDVDFCQTRRDKVIGYVTERYGRDKVGQIITFGSLKARSVIRDVCRVMKLSPSEGDRIAKMVPEVLGITLSQAIEQEPKLRELRDAPKPLGVKMTTPGEHTAREVTTADLLEIAQALEGLTRQPGMHAAGIVISDSPLTDTVPLYQAPGEEALVTQYAKDEVEAAGLVKFDFLGLKTLTVIQDALDLVNRGRPAEDQLIAADLPLNDEAAFALMSKGDTAGIFQMESSGFTEMVKALKPSCFEDVVAAGALYRPGPLKMKLPGTDTTMVELYIERKHGRLPVEYAHPSLEPLLKETYGVIVYQEQVMQISQVLAGYSLGKADMLRRAMGKKKAEVMAKERAGFLAGAIARQIDPEVAGYIFDMMEKFAEYGFNKSHSAAYAVVSMQTAWLKAHHRVEFMAALLSSEMENTDKVVHHIAEARSSGLEVLPPDVNESLKDFSVAGGKIRFGLRAVRGVGDGAIEAIVSVRESGPFKGLFDFCERIDLKKVNRKVIECLVKAGAFDFTQVARKRLFDSLDRALERGQAAQRDRAVGQASLFGALMGGAGAKEKGGGGGAEPYVAGEEWPERERLQYEKEIIGFYISGHPLAQYRRELERLARPCARLGGLRKDTKVTIGGVPLGLRERVLQSGKRMANVTIEDTSGSVPCVCFPGKDGSRSEQIDGKWQRGKPRPGYEDWEALLKSGEPLLVHGTTQLDTRGVESDEHAKVELVVDSIESLAEVRAKRTKQLELRLAAPLATEEALTKLRELCQAHPGTTPMVLLLTFEGRSEVTLSSAMKVANTPDLASAIDRLFGGEVAEYC